MPTPMIESKETGKKRGKYIHNNSYQLISPSHVPRSLLILHTNFMSWIS